MNFLHYLLPMSLSLPFIIGLSQCGKWVLSYIEIMDKICTFFLVSFANEFLCENKLLISGHHLNAI